MKTHFYALSIARALFLIGSLSFFSFSASAMKENQYNSDYSHSDVHERLYQELIWLGVVEQDKVQDVCDFDTYEQSSDVSSKQSEPEACSTVWSFSGIHLQCFDIFFNDLVAQTTNNEFATFKAFQDHCLGKSDKNKKKLISYAYNLLERFYIRSENADSDSVFFYVNSSAHQDVNIACSAAQKMYALAEIIRHLSGSKTICSGLLNDWVQTFTKRSPAISFLSKALPLEVFINLAYEKIIYPVVRDAEKKEIVKLKYSPLQPNLQVTFEYVDTCRKNTKFINLYINRLIGILKLNMLDIETKSGLALFCYRKLKQMGCNDRELKKFVEHVGNLKEITID